MIMMMMVACFKDLSSHFKLMEMWYWKALCNEVSYSHDLNSASSGIRTRDLAIQNQEC